MFDLISSRSLSVSTWKVCSPSGISRSRSTMVPSTLAATAAWARSTRHIDLAVYASAVFDTVSLEAMRPRLIYALLDAPEATRRELGVSHAAAAQAAHAISQGDDRPARQIVDDRVLDQLLVFGTPEAVGHALAARFGPLRDDGLPLFERQIRREAAFAVCVGPLVGHREIAGTRSCQVGWRCAAEFVLLQNDRAAARVGRGARRPHRGVHAHLLRDRGHHARYDRIARRQRRWIGCGWRHF